MKKIGILHPGMMGIYVAASALSSGYDLYWASEGRSDATKKGQNHITSGMRVHWRHYVGNVRF